MCKRERERERERERIVFCLSINVDDQVGISLHTNLHWILVFYEQYDYISNNPKFIQYYKVLNFNNSCKWYSGYMDVLQYNVQIVNVGIFDL